MNAILTLILFIPAVEPASPRANLEKMIASRKSFATADLRWTQESRLTPKMYRRSQFDGKNWTFAEVGDPDGVVRPHQLGNGLACSEHRYLTADGFKWATYEHTPNAQVWEINAAQGEFGFPVIDARTLGILPELHDIDIDGALPWLIMGVRDEDMSMKEEADGISVVKARIGNTILTWWLDSKKGFNPVRIERRRDDKVISDVRIELALYDGHVWFPTRIVQTETRSDGPLILTFEFQSAEFDRPNHPPKLTPEHIGVVSYNMVNWQSVRRKPGCWDGTHIITLDEMVRRRRSGEIAPESLLAWRERIKTCQMSGGGKYPDWMSTPMYGIGKPSDVDAWETYVRRFCLIRKLDDRQKGSARSILDDCRKTAIPLLARIKEQQKKETDVARKEALLSPISEIFTKSLVPRLESLLTTPQSQPTSQVSTSQPTAQAGRASPKM